MIYIGIDPGLSGAIAVINDTDNSVQLFDTPTTVVKSGKKNNNVYVESEIVKILSFYPTDNTKVGLEKQFPMAGRDGRSQGLSSTFKTGYGFGMWVGMLSALKLPFDLLTSQKWKKAMLDGMGKEKAASCVRAQQLYPDCELFTLRGRALDGRGDALLIATYIKSQSQK
jgi:crossover junction endodeoxyribonuclease RuvC